MAAPTRASTGNFSTAFDVLINTLLYQDRRRVKDDVFLLISTYPSLHFKRGNLVYNDGNEAQVVLLSGTVPIFYQGKQYNIPADIFVMEQYPNAGPKVYVRPAANMIVKPMHANVDADGLVYMPYLHEWNPRTSNLSELVTLMVQLFSTDPPLFTKPKVNEPVVYSMGPAAAYTSPDNDRLRSSRDPIITHVNAAPVGMRTSYSPASSDANLAALSSAAQRPSSGSSSATNPTSRRQQLLAELTAKLQLDLSAYYKKLEDEIGEEFANQNELKASAERCSQSIKDMRSHRGALEDALAALESKSAALDKFDASLAGAAEADVMSFVTPYDEVCEQLVRLHAESDAIDDALYFLENSVASTDKLKCDVSSFLKETKRLAKQQFMVKSHIKKINGILEAAAK